MPAEPTRLSPVMSRFTHSAAVLGWLGLSIQLYLVFYGRWSVSASQLGGLVSYFSYFTVLTNTLVATVLTCAVTARESKGRTFFLQPWVSSGIAVSITLVGLAYSLLLRHLWHPQGWQFIADELLHDIMPLLFLFYWWRCVPKGTLRLGHIGLWAIYPVLYFAFTLLRGHSLGLYPYPFIDVEKLGYPQVFINASGILLGFVLIALDRWRGTGAGRVGIDPK
ncbi:MULTISPECIES: Pr6Pr family membrane protein [unclassified Pseudomonas]|uniref:Pr6Pr family membrane protein n=1 Tax=unclassified Pseudomonas TaxID=196821 RepID=UPI001A92D24C|nr:MULTISPECIES: Pr6Pr family membrane protein [unclassified Pseudomonas]